jgi:hypothetical protein
MTTIYRTRTVQVNEVLFDQVEILQTDLFTRVTGLIPSNVSLFLRYNNNTANWPLVSGVDITDSQVASGSVYWNPLASGAYGLRFFPNALGTWVLELAYTGGSPNQRITITYDVFNPLSVETGLRASFT